jgi:hypothetical protein
LALVGKARAGESARLNIDGKTPSNTLTGGKSQMAGTTTGKKKQAMNADEMKKSIAAFDKRRQARLDGEDEPSTIPEKIIIEGVVKPQEGAADAEPTEGEEKEMTLEEKVQEVKDRRDRRDQGGDPEDVEGAKGVIAQQDEDISCLLELLEKLEAAKDFGTAAPIGDKKDGDDGKKDDGDDEGEGVVSKPRENAMNADSVDAIVAERLELGRLGDKLNLDGLETLKPIDAKKKIIAAIKPDLRLDGKGAGYISTAFDIAKQELSSRKTTEHQRKQMFNGKFNTDGTSNQSEPSGAFAARERMQDKILNGGAE